ncbi:MFS transporter permease [Aliiglaciecola sp. CAU 1673]|uniref:MFS transporter permease n=1 Tax=Aliiglaciecola sp. CAU 1673 TaxID=3032595 RepID=UPI0023DAE163|nr:MFS transporter permease [Aliiglaciecola sp. CAU 1673]MDF2179000.1 MFS transporter permease [Aliiglaciecola sp. CAU 1673]
MQSLVQQLRHFGNRTMLSIFLFGIASGFPWVMIGSVMSAWLKDAGLTRSAIGYFSAVFAVYSVNFLWSPLLDRVRLPFIGKGLGQRRSWIFSMQMLICLGCFGLSVVDPTQTLTLAGLLALGIALSSATQDMAIDAYRIESVDPEHSERQSTAAAMATSGWWTGYAGLGAIPFFVADISGWAWPDIYQVLAAMMLLISLGVWIATEPPSYREQQYGQAQAHYLKAIAGQGHRAALLLLALSLAIALCFFQVFGPQLFTQQLYVIAAVVLLLLGFTLHSMGKLLRATPAEEINIRPAHRIITWLLVSLGEPLRDFFSRNGMRLALGLLTFVLLFKLGEAILGRMSIVFYKEIGFSNADIGTYSKLLTWGVTVVASAISGLITLRIGIIKGLFLGGLVMAASNLLFALMASVGPSKPLLFVTIVVDGFTAAWGTVAFMAFISVLCNRAFTASQYALLASVATFGRTTLGAYSGVLVDGLGGNWQWFFTLTALMVLPSLGLLYLMRDKIRAIAGERA